MIIYIKSYDINEQLAWWTFAGLTDWWLSIEWMMCQLCVTIQTKTRWLETFCDRTLPSPLFYVSLPKYFFSLINRCCNFNALVISCIYFNCVRVMIIIIFNLYNEEGKNKNKQLSCPNGTNLGLFKISSVHFGLEIFIFF